MKMIRLFRAMMAAAIMLILVGTISHKAFAQTPGVDVPTIPANLFAAINQSNQVFVSWDASVETNANIVGYYLYRNGKQIANTPGNTFFTDNVAAGVYSYTVSAYDTKGTVSPQSPATDNVTVLPDNSAPTAPTGLVATPSSSSVSLSWNGSSDNFAVIGYYVYRNGNIITTTDPITGTSFDDENLSPGVRYTYSVATYDAVGNISNHTPPATVTTIFDVQPPTAPQGLSAKAVSSNEIDLKWNPSTDNIKVAGYIIYQDGVQLVDTGSTSTTYAVTGLSAGTNYGFGIYAYDEVDNLSVLGSQTGATTFPADQTPPSIPKNLSAKAISSSDVVLTWSPSTDDVGVTGYFIYNGSNQVGSTPSTTFTDSNLSTSTTYQYFVTAYDAAGNVSPPTSIAVTTLANTPAAPTPTPPQSTNSGVAPQIPSTPSSGQTTAIAGSNNFTVNLYYGSRGTSVLALQAFLIKQTDLLPAYGTGFYGSFTTKAVQKFQCDQNIICSGGPTTTGWGSFGPKTRRIANSL